MLNKGIFIGRITADPELKTTSNNLPYLRFTIAIDRSYKDSEGNRKTDFISCIAWRTTAEFVTKYFKKGKMIGVEGSVFTDNYIDDNGIKHYTFDVQVDNVFFTESKPAETSEE